MSKATELMLGSDHSQSVVRTLAAELLIEATERGDLNHPTVTWAVARMLQAADLADRRP